MKTADTVVVRMTGCPNGCARPYMAELGFVGDGPNSYQVSLFYNVFLPGSASYELNLGIV